MSTVTLNGLRAVSARVVIPWRGVPFVDVDLDPDVVQLAPISGPASIVIGTPPVATLLGTIDPLASGSFVAGAMVRVVAGRGGWSKTVPAQHYSNPGGLLSTTVYSTTAAVVGEVVTDLLPQPLGSPDYVRSEGRASRVLDGVDWWVDLVTGTTSVGPRPPAAPDPSLEVLSWDPLTKRAELTCDTLIVPGTVLLDPRIGESPVTIRSVEHTFDAQGDRATAWCSTSAVERLQVALTSLVRELGKTAHLKVYRYRFVQPAGTGVALQAVDRDPLTGAAGPMPDLLPAAMWTGMAGVTAVLPPALEVLVHFVDGDPTQPVVVGYSLLALPLQVTVDAQVSAHLAPTAPAVDVGAGAVTLKLAGGGAGVARAGDPVDFSGLVATAPPLGGPCVLTGVLKIASGSTKVTSG